MVSGSREGLDLQRCGGKKDRCRPGLGLKLLSRRDAGAERRACKCLKHSEGGGERFLF